MQVKLLHPAVLLKYLRLCTAVRLMVRAPHRFWQLLFAARRAKRSWLAAVLQDIHWLKSAGSIFESLDVTSLAEFFSMARRNPRSCIAAIRKTCHLPRALEQAFVQMRSLHGDVDVAHIVPPHLSGLVVDVPTVWDCTECAYTCNTAKQLGCHDRVSHGTRSRLNNCIDSTHCTVCNLQLYTRANVMTHLHDRSPLCRMNLLSRGECVSDAAAVVLASEAAATRLANTKAGKHKHFATRKSVRLFGPFLEVFDLDGNPIVAKNGHPLGPGRAWNRPARLDVKVCNKYLCWSRSRPDCSCTNCASIPADVTCPAALLVQCTDKCVICSGIR